MSEHLTGDGPAIYAHACKLGLEGIVSKRLGSKYRSGRCTSWIKVKNPKAPGICAMWSECDELGLDQPRLRQRRGWGAYLGFTDPTASGSAG